MKHDRRQTFQMVAVMTALLLCAGGVLAGKPNAEGVLQALKDGNANFAAGKLSHPHDGVDRIQLASKTNQGDYAIATIISCSDSRVPLEYIFDKGVMDLFVIRIAGNVCNTDEIGSAEYGVCHVNTPVLVVLGHSQCGAVTAVANEMLGHGHALEKNIPPLVAGIGPAVQRVKAAFPKAQPANLISRSIEENVWQGIEQTFLKSAAIRERAKSGKLMVAGAIYELETGTVRWLPQEKVIALLEKTETAADRSTEAMAAHESRATATAGERGESHNGKEDGAKAGHH